MMKLRRSSPNCSRPLLALRALRTAAILAGLLIPLLWAAPTAAKDVAGCGALEEKALGQPKPLKIDHDGVTGMFFTMPTARLVLCEVKQLRLHRRDAVLVDRGLRLWEDRTTNLKESVALAVEARDHLGSVVAASDRRAREAEARLDHWTRSPTLWLTIGVVGAGLLVGLTAYALNSAK